MFTGNRGCLVDDARQVVRHHAGNLWITCVTEFRGWSHPLDAPHRWTPIFFLDDAVALAAGHRPCGLCRRDDYRSYSDAVDAARDEHPTGAAAINRQLATERLRRGSGVQRRTDRKQWLSPVDELPDGAVIVGDDGEPRLVVGASTYGFDFGGWTSPSRRAASGQVAVITPPLSVAALRFGFQAVLHLSASLPHTPTR